MNAEIDWKHKALSEFFSLMYLVLILLYLPLVPVIWIMRKLKVMVGVK